uniref:Uncharacterized protein n=1 Tax=Anguilla anguilla TaxID=7936 RepID=A0A0E9X1B1_ANGAN
MQKSIKHDFHLNDMNMSQTSWCPEMGICIKRVMHKKSCTFYMVKPKCIKITHKRKLCTLTRCWTIINLII